MSTIIHGSTRKSKEKRIFTKDDPFLASIKERVLLNKPGSCKKTFHVALDITDSSIVYHEGDAVGIWPQNDPLIVSSLLNLLATPKDVLIQDPRSHQSCSLEHFLYHKANLSRVTIPLLQLLSTSTLSTTHLERLQQLLTAEHKILRTEYIKAHDVVTCLKDFAPQNIDVLAFVLTLAPMLPRFYSIASSQSHYPNEMHLLVNTFTYSVQNELRTGLGSHFLCHTHLSSVPLYVQHNPNFTLPANPETPIIMIGPGTGIAPYRAFLQKRASLGVKTRNWLFFGECNEAYDFYYQEELHRYVHEGLLELSTAFSRDQAHKIYVQHHMMKHSHALWSWINEGAHLYVCGDATHMAKDVTETLLTIIQQEGGLSIEHGKSFLQHLRKEKRFQSDVY